MNIEPYKANRIQDMMKLQRTPTFASVRSPYHFTTSSSPSIIHRLNAEKNTRPIHKPRKNSYYYSVASSEALGVREMPAEPL